MMKKWEQGIYEIMLSSQTESTSKEFAADLEELAKLAYEEGKAENTRK